MSFNITADGSPTPRKARFLADDLRIDTSPEVLGMAAAVGSRYQQFPLYRPDPSLTFNMQGMKRPLGSSALNQPLLPPQQNHFEFKVSQVLTTF